MISPFGSLWLPDDDDVLTAASPSTPHGRADVVVVGAGLAGLCTAWLCAEAGASVAVVEAGAVARRTTGHSTAKITALHGLIYRDLERRHGQEGAAAYAAANDEGMRRLVALATDLDIECALTEAPAYTCAATADGVGAIEEEVEAAARAGLAVTATSQTELGELVHRAVRLDGQAHFDPFAFCTGLARRLAERDVAIYEGVRVTDVEEGGEGGGGCVVSSADGFRLECDQVVLTTHLPISDPAFLSGRVKPQRSYAVAGPTSMAAPPDGMYLAHDAGWSVRPWRTASGSGLIVGGEGHAMTDHVDSARHYRDLGQLAERSFGVGVVHQWSAFDYVTTDLLPFIGPLTPRSRRRFVATGFRKWGMSTSMVAASIISDRIAGRDNRYASTFDSTRLRSTISPDLLMNTLQVGRHWVGRRATSLLTARRDEPSLLPGEGRVESRRGVTVAVARDHAGTLHTLNAACTHLGCVVGFNDAEQTWDCPCHGSRFGLDGSVIDGPATRPLSSVRPDADAEPDASAEP